MGRIVSYDEQELQNIVEDLGKETTAEVSDFVESVRTLSGSPGLRPESIESFDLNLSVVFDIAVDSDKQKDYTLRTVKDRLFRPTLSSNRPRKDSVLKEASEDMHPKDWDYTTRLPVSVDLPDKDKLSQLDAHRISVRVDDSCYDSITEAVEDLDRSVSLYITPSQQASDHVSDRFPQATFHYTDTGKWELTDYRNNGATDEKSRYKNIGYIEDMLIDSDLDVVLNDDMVQLWTKTI